MNHTEYATVTVVWIAVKRFEDYERSLDLIWSDLHTVQYIGLPLVRLDGLHLPFNPFIIRAVQVKHVSVPSYCNREQICAQYDP
jgi:hypothetical protein